ncbi:MAG: galactose-1-epimerase [Bacteroidales bacterium]|nr:galactose-1-epimerase [Bacteroidales bacterium]
MKIVKEKEISFKDDKIVVIKLVNKNNLEIKFSNYGATLLSILVPDKEGEKIDITIGRNNIEDYLENHDLPEKYYFGCTVGRFANRIAKGQFAIAGKVFLLSQNEGKNHLHGGFKGLHKVTWDYKINEDQNEIMFSYLSPDGDEGYPGNFKIELSVSLNDLNEIRFKYKATTDKATPVSLTNHAYFNLNGGKSSILNHRIHINSDFFLENDKYGIPTGKLIPVAKTNYDFSIAKNLSDSEIMQNEGYDKCYVLNKLERRFEFAGSIREINNPISLEVYTSEPSLQLYTANAFDGSFKGKNGVLYSKFHGVCMEAQRFPDSPNHNNFPSSILYPGEVYEQETIYKIQF